MSCVGSTKDGLCTFAVVFDTGEFAWVRAKDVFTVIETIFEKMAQSPPPPFKIYFMPTKWEYGKIEYVPESPIAVFDGYDWELKEEV